MLFAHTDVLHAIAYGLTWSQMFREEGGLRDATELRAHCDALASRGLQATAYKVFDVCGARFCYILVVA